MWNVFAFMSLGLLIGNLVGLTAESTVSALIGLLFAFVGGSAISFMHKLSVQEQIIASKAILSLSLTCLLGVYIGITVSDNQWLTLDSQISAQRLSVMDRKYVRENLLEKAHAIDQQKANKQITVDAAYEELYKLVTSEEKSQ